MSDAQLEALYCIERTEEGYPKLSSDAASDTTPRQLSAREIFTRRCYLIGATDASVVERLWSELTGST